MQQNKKKYNMLKFIMKFQMQISSQPVVPYTHTHRGFKIALANTNQAHEKYL